MNGIVTFSLERINRSVTIGDLFQRLGRLALLAFRVSEERRQLAELVDWQLEDIGVTRAQADAEAKRPLEDIPFVRSSGLYR